MSPREACRFPRLNFWRNPFGELAPDERAALAVVEQGDVIDWLKAATRQNRRVVEYIGPCGHGKSSHLLALSSRLDDCRYVYVPEAPPWPEIPAEGRLIVDEADRLPWLRRRGLLANSRLIAVGCHESLAPALSRRNVEVKVVEVANRGDERRLLEVLNRRVISSVADPTAPHLLVKEADVRWLIEQYGDDIRSMERYLYERVQRMEGAADGEMRFCLRS